LQPGVYGTQRVDLLCYDGGFSGAADQEFVRVELTITVACPVNDEDLKDQTIEIAENVSRKITPEMLLNTKEEPQRADGYKITGITVEGNLRLIAPAAAVGSAATSSVIESAADNNDWYVQALRRGGSSDKMTVTFDVGGITRTNNFTVKVTENHKPTLNAGTVKFTKSDLREGNIITISPDAWFSDSDIDDVMRFVSPVKVSSSQYADAFLHENTNSIDLKFKYRGSTTITVTVSDATNRLYTYELNVECTDMPEPGWFTTFVNDIELHPIRWGLIFGGILLFIILLIILIVVICRRRRMRREIEMLLNSEAELNEEMMRLNSGAGATMYQSYGYLPPTTQTFNDPGLMLGSSANNPTPNSLQLGMGTGQSMGVQQNSQGVYPQTGPRYNNIPTDSMPGTVRPAGTPPVNSMPGTVAPNNDGFDPNSF
ncbi:MAG: hypothetical protein K2M48_07035, partial [Clostridiales bacterium]|nr:hypothetical protein [Clostridiales bacterium]